MKLSIFIHHEKFPHADNEDLKAFLIDVAKNYQMYFPNDELKVFDTDLEEIRLKNLTVTLN